MGKNQKFSAKYTIEVNGRTTNGFMNVAIEKILNLVVHELNIKNKQTNVTLKKEN
jgi:hypothetical protein